MSLPLVWADKVNDLPWTFFSISSNKLGRDFFADTWVLSESQKIGIDKLIKLFSVIMLNSTEYEFEIYPANKCSNANNCWHF